MWTLRAPISAIGSSAIRKSSSSSSSWPTSCSASCWFGETSHGSASMPRRSGSPSASSTTRAPSRVISRTARRRSPRRPLVAASRRTRPSTRRARGSGACRAGSRARPRHLRAPLVDLGVGAGGRVDDGGGRARLVPDPHEVVEDRLLGQLLDDPRPVRPPASPVATTGTSSRLSARATLMPLPPASASTLLARCRWPSLKIGTVSERSSAALRVTVTITRVTPSETWTLRDEPDEMVDGAAGVPRDLPAVPTAETDSAATSGVRAISLPPANTRTSPTCWPRTTGSARAELATTRSTSGLPTRTVRTTSSRATSLTEPARSPSPRARRCGARRSP